MKHRRWLVMIAVVAAYICSFSVTVMAQGPTGYHGGAHGVSGTSAVRCVAGGECWRQGTRIVYRNGVRVVVGTYNGKAVTAYTVKSARFANGVQSGKYAPTQVSGRVKASTVASIVIASARPPTEVFAAGTVIANCPRGVAACWGQYTSTRRN